MLTAKSRKIPQDQFRSMFRRAELEYTVLDLDARPHGKDCKDRQLRQVIWHWLRVETAQMADDLAVSVEDRKPEIALITGFPREQLFDAAGDEGELAFANDGIAGRAFEVELDVLGEPAVFPAG